MADSTAIAIVSVLVAGFTAIATPLITGFTEGKREARRFRLERQEKDFEELRKLLDEAGEVLWAFKEAVDWLQLLSALHAIGGANGNDEAELAKATGAVGTSSETNDIEGTDGTAADERRELTARHETEGRNALEAQEEAERLRRRLVIRLGRNHGAVCAYNKALDLLKENRLEVAKAISAKESAAIEEVQKRLDDMPTREAAYETYADATHAFVGASVIPQR